MKITNEQLKQIIKEELEYVLEEWDRESLQALKKKRPGYAFTTPRRKFSKYALMDKWGRLLDEEGEESLEPVYPEEDIAPEALRARAAQMARAGMEPDHVRKLSVLGKSDLQDLQPFEIADSLMDEPLQGRNSPELEKLVASKRKIKDAYDELHDSAELRYWVDLFHYRNDDDPEGTKRLNQKAHHGLRRFIQEITYTYGLKGKEVDKLRDMLGIPKNL